MANNIEMPSDFAENTCNPGFNRKLLSFGEMFAVEAAF